VLNDQLLGYVEFSLSERRTLFSEYLRLNDSSLPPDFIAQFPLKDERPRLESSLGISYTSPSNIVTTLEYHHSDLGANDDEQQAWYSMLQNNPLYTQQLYGIRSHYLDNEQPFFRDALWFRTVWAELGEKFELGILSHLVVDDDSYMTQASIKYDFSGSIDLEFRASFFIGDDESFYGSIARDSQYLFQLSWHG
jgi:hypothetical protein